MELVKIIGGALVALFGKDIIEKRKRKEDDERASRALERTIRSSVSLMIPKLRVLLGPLETGYWIAADRLRDATTALDAMLGYVERLEVLRDERFKGRFHQWVFEANELLRVLELFVAGEDEVQARALANLTRESKTARMIELIREAGALGMVTGIYDTGAAGLEKRAELPGD